MSRSDEDNDRLRPILVVKDERTEAAAREAAIDSGETIKRLDWLKMRSVK